MTLFERLVSWQAIRSAGVNIFLVIVAIIFAVPLVWMLETAVKTQADIYHLPTVWWPHKWLWGNFARTWNSAPFTRFFVNTFIVAALSTVGTVITSALGGYALARMRFPGRQTTFLLILATLMIPFQVIVIPLFLIMKDLALVNTVTAIILPNLASGFGIFLMRQFFLHVPQEIEESAIIEGASRVRILWSIMMPLARPAVATLVLFSFMWAWNSYFWPLIVVTSPSNMTIQVGLSYFQGIHSTNYALLQAGSTLAIAPLVLLFLATRRQFVEGLMAGAVR